MGILFVFAWSALACFAQVDSGAVSGVVTDRSGAVVPGAKVRILQLDTNAGTDLETNESGFYSAPSLRPGRYEVSIAKDGFHPQKSHPLDLRVQDRAEINFQLELGTTKSQLTVLA